MRSLLHSPIALGLLLPACCAFAQQQNAVAPAVAQEQNVAVPTGDEIVTMSAFNVGTALGTYHQETSSMANKLPTNTKEIASSLSIMDQAAITDRNAVTLSDVFGYVTGATQSQSNINGFAFRGFPNTGSYTQNIQFDGLMGATLKKASEGAANVDSLEFLKGPNSVLYGQMNPGGLLNIITKSPSEIQQVNLRATVGFFSGQFSAGITKSFSVDVTGPVPTVKGLYYRLITDLEAEPQSRPGDYDNDISVYPSLTYKFTPDTFFTVKMETSQDHRRQDDGLLPIFNNGTAYGPHANWYTAPLNTVYQDNEDWARDYGEALSTFLHLSLGAWTFRAQSRAVWHVDILREETINNANIFSPTATYATPTALLRRQYNFVKNGHRYDYGDANLFRSFTWDKITDTVMIGVGGGAEFFGNQRISFGPNQPVADAITLINPVLNQAQFPADGTGATNQLTNQDALGEYVSDQFKLFDRVHGSLGVRHDDDRVHGLNTLSPALTRFATEITPYLKQVGLLYDVTPELSAYGTWSQSAQPQTTIAYDITGNSHFPPQTAEQFEEGLKFENSAKNLNATAAIYKINRTNVIVASGTNFTVATGAAQVGQAISRLDGGQQSTGAEVEGQYQPIPNWQLQGGVAYSVAVVSNSITNPRTLGLYLVNAPRTTGNFWTRYNIPSGYLKGVGVGCGVVYVGQAWAGDPTTTVYYQLPGWTRVDAALYYRYGRLNFTVNVQNLADRRYISASTSALELNPGEQRKITFSVSTRF